MTDIRCKWVYEHTTYGPKDEDVKKDLESFAMFGKASVSYIPGEFVTAPDWLAIHEYHLLVFDNEESANVLGGISIQNQLWECECEEEVYPPPSALSLSDFINGIFVPTHITCNWPKGTKMYKRVKLTRRLK